MKFKLRILTIVRIGIIAISGLLIIVATGLGQDGTWTPKKDMPTQRWTPSASAVNGKIYVIGGFSIDRVLSTNEEYDPVTDTWKSKWEMLAPRNALSTNVVDGKIYAIGGQFVFPQQLLSAVEEYNTATGMWKTRKDMRYPRMALSASMVNGKFMPSAVHELMTAHIIHLWKNMIQPQIPGQQRYLCQGEEGAVLPPVW